MADDRHEAYRSLFTRSQIREIIQRLNLYDQADFVYMCIQQALNNKQLTATVNDIVQQVSGNEQPSSI